MQEANQQGGAIQIIQNTIKHFEINQHAKTTYSVPDAFADFGVPQADRTITRARGNESTLGVPVHAFHVALVAQQDLFGFVPACCPQVQAAIVPE